MSNETRIAVVPNSCGARLVRCVVSVQKEPPTVDSRIEYLPIVAFSENENGSFIPLSFSGPIVGWGELRASVIGCYVYGVAFENCEGVETVEGRYASIQKFTEYAVDVATRRIAEVRREKGWPGRLIPRTGETLDDIEAP